MPAVPISDAELISALNLVEQYGSAWLAVKAGVTPLSRNCIRNRSENGILKGLKPTYKKDAIRYHERKRIGRMHLVIPDVQMRHGVRDDHMTWIGNYIVEKQPDVIVVIGDFADMESISTYLKPKEREGKRYWKDIASVHKALDKLFAPLREYNRTAKYEPELHFTMGNHEHRIVRFIDEHPELENVIGLHDLKYESYGFKVHPFLKVVKIDGVEYSHYFTSGTMGRPCSSAAVQLRTRQCSSIAGHVQHTDIAMHPKTQQIAMFVGTCYLHDEKYLGQQDNCQRRQVVMLHEVEDGRFDPMFASLRYLEKAYG